MTAVDQRPPTECDLTLTMAEAAAFLDLHCEHLMHLARQGCIDAVRVQGWWLFDGPSLQRYREATRPRRERRLPAAPFLRHVELRGGPAACGVQPHSAEERALERARDQGYLTFAAADRLATAVLGLCPREVWGDDWWAV